MATKKATKTGQTAEQPKHNPNALYVPTKPDEELSIALAGVATRGVTGNGCLVQQFTEGTVGKGQVSLMGCIDALSESAKATHGGDLKEAESLLVAQASALNAIFCELARRAGSNMGQNLGATESYMRLALKAQSQSRSTIETLASIKNPSVVIARQANINNGGQQQVNNGTGKATVDVPTAKEGGTGSLPATSLEAAPSATQSLSSASTRIQTTEGAGRE